MVTGAARGIGAASVAALAADGWYVVAVDACETGPDMGYPRPTAGDLEGVVRRAEQATGRQAVEGQAAEGQAAEGHVAEGHVVDVRDRSALDSLLAALLARQGRLDAVVAAAGIISGGRSLWETSDTEWDLVLDTDLSGTWRTMAAAIPHVLVAPGPRRLVAVASAAGSLGMHRLGPYVVAKHGVIGLVRALAADLAGTGVTANAVSPGSTRSALLDASLAVYGLGSEDELVARQAPLGRIIEPNEVAETIVWLCSTASAAVTGAVVAVDGGMTATA